MPSQVCREMEERKKGKPHDFFGSVAALSRWASDGLGSRPRAERHLVFKSCLPPALEFSISSSDRGDFGSVAPLRLGYCVRFVLLSLAPSFTASPLRELGGCLYGLGGRRSLSINLLLTAFRVSSEIRGPDIMCWSNLAVKTVSAVDRNVLEKINEQLYHHIGERSVLRECGCIFQNWCQLVPAASRVYGPD